jgi:hypothetical protein
MEADSETLFKKLLKDLRPIFKENGFRASGQNFVLESPECWVVVNFQKSRWSRMGEKTFYINVASTPKRVLAFHDLPVEKAPQYIACDWRWRVEQLGPDNDIKDWTIRDEATARAELTYLENLFKDYAFLAIATMTSEAALLEIWPNSGFEYPLLKARTVLLAANGKVAELQQAVDTLISRFGIGVVAEGVQTHLKALRAKFPCETRDLVG